MSLLHITMTKNNTRQMRIIPNPSAHGSRPARLPFTSLTLLWWWWWCEDDDPSADEWWWWWWWCRVESFCSAPLFRFSAI